MKRPLFLILLTALAMTLAAQQRPSFIGLQAGPSFPVGKFYAKELPEGGFAQPGLSASLEGAWFFTSWLGAGASIGMNLHSVDVSTLGYEKVLDNPFLNDLTIRSDPYQTYSLYSGLFFQFHLVKRFSLTAKALGGIIYTQTPYQLYKADYFVIGEDWYEITSAGDFEGSFLTGAGLRYDLNDCIGFSLNAAFTYNVMDFEFNLPDGSIRTDKKVVAFVDVLLGVIIKIS